MSSTTAEGTIQSGHSDPIYLHWIMTVQTGDGRQGTNNGRISATPGLHTHESTYVAVLKQMEQWLGTSDLTVLFFSLTSNQF